MNLPFQAVQSPYYGDAYYRTPPPDLPSLLLKERIVYLGMPLVPAVTELIIAELLYLQYEDPEKPINIYINSTGTSGYSGEPIGFETEAFAICDTIRYINLQCIPSVLERLWAWQPCYYHPAPKVAAPAYPMPVSSCTNRKAIPEDKHLTFKSGPKKC
jgi:hypothetical protein